ncbi:LOW QUALITY PROTEIN: CCR4-NOT transcription complex subunit 9-like [Dromiciops gliroides]|uniref:LOW QUALITY PROTEIN: CCR4-NOT transcription complex subunit 9-like n=1 Tax=Dromiciops gliroides TaxID=33562 RepID=UPI001CC7C71A|nr:LOW QUALITY PROTEIN: CCR4-NOT transcription complex subunit 9-like [Dromiciops gliroides]
MWAPPPSSSRYLSYFHQPLDPLTGPQGDPNHLINPSLAGKESRYVLMWAMLLKELAYGIIFRGCKQCGPLKRLLKDPGDCCIPMLLQSNKKMILWSRPPVNIAVTIVPQYLHLLLHHLASTTGLGDKSPVQMLTIRAETSNRHGPNMCSDSSSLEKRKVTAGYKVIPEVLDGREGTKVARATPKRHSQAMAVPVPTALAQVDREKFYQWINELPSLETRENALLELSKNHESVPELAPMLWYSFVTVAALLQEIENIYPSINPPTLTAHQSKRDCNALALLQDVASHPETRLAFLATQIRLFLYPFLQRATKTPAFEYLCLTSLGVTGALVKTDEQEVINFLLATEIIPLCLHIMESGSKLSKTITTLIFQKILLNGSELTHICQTYEQFSQATVILGQVVPKLFKETSAQLLKHVIRCYLRLSDNPMACGILRQCLPDQLKDTTFTQVLKDETTTKHWFAQLVENQWEGQVTDPHSILPHPQ